MASIFLKTPVYITSREVIDSTAKVAMIPFVDITNEPLQTNAIIWDKIFFAQKNFDDIVASNIIVKTAGVDLILDTDYRVFVDDGTLWKLWYTYIEILTVQTWAITANYRVVTSDESLKILIYKAEREIDAYIWNTYRPRYDNSQDFLFPVVKDSVSWIPDEIKEACLYVVEQVYSSGDTVSSSVWWGVVKSERMWPRSVTYSEWQIIIWSLVPDIAKKMLDSYKNFYFSQVL